LLGHRNRAGKDGYPGGGSNGYRTRAWKIELAALATETGLQITVYPTGVKIHDSR
jgi:hypothetical protein